MRTVSQYYFNLLSYVDEFSEQELWNADVLINIFSP